ncbi:phosphate acetyltransferase [Muribaculum intestinale]|jgi:phosphate acetyltransferase|uniref:Phosphate acetyltransferase n=4 Tax=Muribaculum intestinale TaxID=1796646 RepID=A0A1B1S9H2_9BACT|nr:phosphate acetyltransferase [Muribaculum intestinale]ROS81282.1 phosphate acetyltransferase [Muribaculaceae bacterium Isolate-042 (Harlan)]ROT09491.1 phosphate acetyltransferase [Muribaculaceae bacterium Isolate-100 (HZI)]RXE65304.1 phosphate acetyltransferase [Muribaculaceae bacterium Isolate-007 (NCI)]GFI68174.1 phosphate acetyltransferase [Muribaculaceae bacterium]ANU63445.1 phosphate acetyltransferase [Muribaculum intestinale]
MGLFEKLTKKAKEERQRIVLPEGTEPRTLTAADRIITEGIADVILIGDPKEIAAAAAELSLTNICKARIVNPADEKVIDKYAPIYFDLRKKKGITIEEARVMTANPLYLGCLMIKNGDADGQVAGALNTTGNVLRAAFQVVKTKPGINSVSGAFVMLLPENSPFGEDGILVFADCAVIPDPDAAQLAEIALSAADTARDIAGITPRIALLSFSTKGSAKHERVEKVIEATKMLQESHPELLVDGELQADAALVPGVAKQKAPGSALEGRADVLIFPSLETGNIAYKLVQRLAGVQAVGPILQGLAAPVNDLSRGCFPEDIYKTIIITCNQAIGAKHA